MSVPLPGSGSRRAEEEMKEALADEEEEDAMLGRLSRNGCFCVPKPTFRMPAVMSKRLHSAGATLQRAIPTKISQGTRGRPHSHHCFASHAILLSIICMVAALARPSSCSFSLLPAGLLL